MDRLTEYICGAAHGKRGRTIEEAGKSKDFCRGEFEATGCIDKLAQYEDTGLEPDEIKDHEEMFKAYRHVCGGLAPDEIPHWIPVGERLPKESGHYLVISKMNWAHGGNWEDDSGDIRRHIAIAFFDRVVKFNIPYVTHWQPLPAAPKEEK